MRWFYYVMLFLMGFIVFSPFSSYVALNILHLPISAPEILFVLFIPFCWKNFRFGPIREKTVLIGSIIWLSLIGISMIINEFGLYDIFATSRSYLYIIVFYVLFSSNNNFTLRDAFCVSVGCLIGWLLEAVRNYSNILMEGEDAVCPGPMLILPILIGFVGIKRKYLYLFIITIIAIIIGGMSGMRREWFILAVSLILLLVYYILQNRKVFWRYLIFLSILGVIIATSYQRISDEIYAQSPYLHKRIFTKTEQFLSEDDSNDGDDLRKQFMIEVIECIPNSIVPKGFVSKQTNMDETLGRFNDVPMLELEYTFSIFGALFLTIYFCIASYRLYRRIRVKLIPDINFIFVEGGVIMVLLLFLEGSFISYPYMTPITGYFLGNIKRISGLKLIFLGNKLS